LFYILWFFCVIFIFVINFILKKYCNIFTCVILFVEPICSRLCVYFIQMYNCITLYIKRKQTHRSYMTRQGSFRLKANQRSVHPKKCNNSNQPKAIKCLQKKPLLSLSQNQVTCIFQEIEVIRGNFYSDVKINKDSF
jgi:hypothetical protein